MRLMILLYNEIESEKFNMAVFKPEVPISQLVGDIVLLIGAQL